MAASELLKQLRHGPLASSWRTVRSRLGSKTGVAWLLGATALLVASTPLAAFVSSPGRTWEKQILEDFNSGHLAVPGALNVRAGFLSNQDGWYLPARTRGELSYRIDKAAGSNLAAQVWLYAPGPSVAGELRVNSGGRSQAFTNPYFVGQVIDLAPTDSETSVELVLSATNTAANSVLVFDQLVYGPTRGVAPPRPGAASIIAFGALFGLIALPFVKRARWSWLIALAIGLMMTVTVSERLDALDAHSSDTLDPDAIVYRIYADSFEWWPPWDHGIFSANFSEREPLFPLVAHAYFDVLGSADFHLRVVSSSLSVLAVLLTLAAARRRLSWPAALVVAGIVALNRPLVDESIRGLRTELEMCLVIALYVLLDRPPSTRPRLDGALIGLVGLALVLTRTFYLPMILVAIGISLLARYHPPSRAVLPLSMATVLVVGAAAGHRLALYERQGDAFYDTTGYARWNANIEQFERGGKLPHPELFPSKAEFIEKGPYSGPRITYSQYLFELHSFPEFIAGTVTGFADVFANTGGTYVPDVGRVLGFIPRSAAVAKTLTGLVDQGVKWMGVAGLLAMLVSAVARRRPQDLLLPAMVTTGLAFTTFLYHLQLVERYRNTIQFYPFLAIAGAWLLQEIIRLALSRRKPVRSGRRTRTRARRA